MEIRFNLTGQERKALVGAISEIKNEPMTYLGAPTFAYTVGACTIDRNGTLLCHDTDAELSISVLLQALQVRGYIGETEDQDDTPTPSFEDLALSEREELGLGREHRDPIGEDGMQLSDVENYSLTDSPDIVSIEFPKDGFSEMTVANLRKLVESKAALIKKAFNAEELPIEETEETLIFPWVKTDDALVADTMDAYIRFITALCEMVKEATRVTAKEKPVENEKYAFRCFLLRLGFIGDDSKAARKVLLRNLSGNGSFKSGERKQDSVETVLDADAVHFEDNDLAEALADAALIHAVNASFEEAANE